MRIFSFLFLILLCLAAKSQVVTSAEVMKRMKSNTKFYNYAREMTRFIKEGQRIYAKDSLKKKFYDKQEKFLARQLWYLEGRQDENGHLTNYTQRTFNAFNQYNTHRASIEPNAIAYGNWSIVGPNHVIGNTSSMSIGIGRADRIAFHPTAPGTLLVGTPSSGIFKTINGGDSWANLNSFLPSLGISGLVISWSDPNIIYALTGDGDSNIGDNGFVQGLDFIRPSIGVLKSIDGGVTWDLTSDLGINEPFYTGYKLVQSPTSFNTLIAATSFGLYRTTNGGLSWSKVSSSTNRFFDIEWKPGSSTTVYACSADSFYISTDGGASFVNQTDNLDIPVDSSMRMAIAVTPANPNVVYLFAAMVDSGSSVNKGVYKSTNSGNTMTQITALSTMIHSVPGYMLNIAAAANNANVVLTGNLNIYRSTTGAAPFNTVSNDGNGGVSNYVHADVHDLAFNPLDNVLYVACDGGIYRSTDNGSTFTAKYTGFTATQYYHFDIASTDNDIMMTGAQDNGGIYREGDFTTFKKVIGGDAYDVQFFNGSTIQAYVSVNTSLYIVNVNVPGFNSVPGLGGGWFKTIATAPSNVNLAFTSSGPIYRTTNGGNNWSNVGANGRWAMITCPNNANRIYAAGGAEIDDRDLNDSVEGKKFYRSDNQGTNWTEIQDNPGLPSTITKITGIAVSPSNSSQVWITMGGFAAGRKVYYSNNAGDSWTNLSGTLPNVPINCIVIDDNLDAYIGTDVGVFFKAALMTDWQPFFNGLPPIPVTELIIRAGNIYASTFGRGIWRSETHGDCPRGLVFTGIIQGIKFYEAIQIEASNTLRGGLGTEFYLRAQSYISLTRGFRADGSTGEKFRAWIGDCGSGAIPQSFTTLNKEWELSKQSNQFTIEKDSANTVIKLNMPFDGKASIVLLDEKQQLKEVLLNNHLLSTGPNSLILDPSIDWEKYTMALLIDGKIAGLRISTTPLKTNTINK